MIPDAILSSTAVPAPFLSPKDEGWLPNMSREYGGIALRDASQGLRVQIWTAQISGDDVTVSAPSVPSTVLFTRSGVTEISLSFDQNMNPAVAFVQDGVMWLWWFDTVAQEQVFTEFNDGSNSPRLALDDKRPLETGSSDIILTYTRDHNLYFLAQRDRFGNEYFLKNIEGFLLRQFGMNTVNRMQWSFITDPDTLP